MSGTQWPTKPAPVGAPRWRVLLNGVVLYGCESVEVHSTNHRAASTFSAKFAMDADPGELNVWFDADPPLMVEVQAGILPPGAAEGSVSWQSVFTGEVNDIDLDPPQGGVEVHGRDLMGRLIDARISQLFPNQTSSEIATTLAGMYGLTADVDATTTPAGDYYQLEHDHVAEDGTGKTKSPNEILLFLAGMDGYDYWVDGTVLHYKKPIDADTTTPLLLVYKPRGPLAYPVIALSDIRCHRSLILDKGIVVVVTTWQPKAKSSHEIRFPPGAKKDAHEYTFTRANLSPDKALAFAQSMYADITRHERTVDIALPGEFQLRTHGPGSVVELSGAPGSSFNIRYYVDERIYELSLSNGFQEHAVLKNHSPQSGGTVS